MTTISTTDLNQQLITEKIMNEEDDVAWAKRSADDAMHSFSPTLARKHSLTGAIVLGYLAFVLNKKEKLVAGKKRYYMTLKELAEIYPYLGRTTIDESLNALHEANIIEISKHNKLRYDRTRDYAIIDQETLKLARTDHLYFSRMDAVDFRVVGAVLLYNLKYWLRENQKKHPEYVWHKMSPTELENSLPFSADEIKRGLATLVKKGAVTKQQMPGVDRTNYYSLTNPEIHDALGQNRITIGGKADDIGRKADIHRANTDSHRANLDIHRANTDDYTILIDNVNRQHLKDTVKRQRDIDTPAAPSSLALISEEENKPQSSEPNTPLQLLAQQVNDSSLKAEEKQERVRTFILTNKFSSINDFKLFHEISTSAYSEDAKFNLFLAHDTVYWVKYFNCGHLFQLLAMPHKERLRVIWDHLYAHIQSNLQVFKAEDANVFVTCGTYLICTAVQRYLGEDNNEESHATNHILHALFSTLHNYYNQNLAILKEKKLDHLKSVVQLREESMASPDRRLENDPNQHHSKKADILNNGIMAMNRIGTFSDGEFRPCQFKASTRDIKAAAKLFEANVTLTPAHIMNIMKSCQTIADNWPEHQFVTKGQRDPYFYQRKGIELGFLLRNFGSVIQNPEMGDIECPVTDFLSPEKMFGPKKEYTRNQE